MTLTPGNPMTKVLMSVTAFEIIVFGLGCFVMIQISNRPVPVALTASGVAVVLALAATATLRRPLGFYLGWLAQIVGVGLGFLSPAMFIIAVLFGGLWVITFVLGKRLEAAGTVAGQ